MEFRKTTDERVGPKEKLGPPTPALLVHNCAGSAPPVVFAAKANTRPSLFAMNTTSFAPFMPGKPVFHAGAVKPVSSGSLSAATFGLAPGVPVNGYTHSM